MDSNDAAYGVVNRVEKKKAKLQGILWFGYNLTCCFCMLVIKKKFLDCSVTPVVVNFLLDIFSGIYPYYIADPQHKCFTTVR